MASKTIPGPPLRSAASASPGLAGNEALRRISGPTPAPARTWARPRAFHSVSARPSPLRVVVKPPVTSKCHGTPSAARATSEIVSPTPAGGRCVPR